MPPDLALLSTLIGSNYPCLELIFMVPKVFEPLKFDCSFNRFLQRKIWKVNPVVPYLESGIFLAILGRGPRALQIGNISVVNRQIGNSERRFQ